MLLLLACSSPPPECPPCEAVEEAPSALAPWEQELLAEPIADIRKGVRPFDREGSFGVCSGQKDCDAFLGADAGELSEGPHMVVAELAVPAAGEGWGARFDVECAVLTTVGRETSVEQSRSYDLVHTGSQRGFLLKPLWIIQSPHPQGSRDCTYTLTSVRPDGQDGDTVRGSYSTPMPPE